MLTVAMAIILVLFDMLILPHTSGFICSKSSTVCAFVCKLTIVMSSYVPADSRWSMLPSDLSYVVCICMFHSFRVCTPVQDLCSIEKYTSILRGVEQSQSITWLPTGHYLHSEPIKYTKSALIFLHINIPWGLTGTNFYSSWQIYLQASIVQLYFTHTSLS